MMAQTWARGLRAGDEVRVRSLDEIRATLDGRGALDGLPFMPEMERHAGRRFRVYKRADRVCVEGLHTLGRVRDTVFLDDLRCDGGAHGGCERGCLIFWKEAWLEIEARDAIAERPWLRPWPTLTMAAATEALGEESPTVTREPGVTPFGSGTRPGFGPGAGPGHGPGHGIASVDEARFVCQSTRLADASTPVAWWDARQYLRDLWTGNLSASQLVGTVVASLATKVETLRARRKNESRTIGKKTPSASLGLFPGELVEVKSLAEITPTLDGRGRNRGLEFAPGMADLCGQRLRVLRRVERMILETTGTMIPLQNTVVLEGGNCTGRCARGCPRANPLYFREIWLRRVSETAART